MVPGARRGAAIVAVIGAMLTAAPAGAEPDPGTPDPTAPPAAAEPSVAPAASTTDPAAVPAVATEALPPVDDGKVSSSPPQTTTSPDGWTLMISSKDETQKAVAPLTTAISTREYAVGGVFNGSLEGPADEPPRGCSRSVTRSAAEST